MNIEIIKEELKYLGEDINNCSDEHILTKFNEYAIKNSQKIKIKDLIDNYSNTSFFVNTPDGFQEIGDFYIKSPSEIYDIETVDGFRAKSAKRHLYETLDGWKFAEEIKKSDYILTKIGYRKVKKITISEPEIVYDFEVLHENHRYWAGNGLSSHNTGKTFLGISILRNAQQMNYFPIIYDSEGSMDENFAKRLGIDTTKIRLENVGTIEDFATKAAKLNETISKIRESGKIPPKVIVFLDSLSNLSSLKEVEDTVGGNNKRDMTKQQSIRRMFRVIGNEFAKNGIPFIVSSHVYAAIGAYVPTNEISGGGGAKYNASIIFMLSKSKLTDKESEDYVKKADIETNRVGIVVTVNPVKQRFARPIKTQIHIPFYKKPNPFVGLEKYVSWQNCGIIRGKLLSEKEYLKLNETEKKKCHEFITSDNIKKYAFEKDTARTLVCKHLESEIPLGELYTEKVFTLDILKQLDENVIKKTFMLPSIESLEDLTEISGDLLDNAEVSDEDMDNIDYLQNLTEYTEDA